MTPLANMRPVTIADGLVASGLTKVYRSGDLEIHALRGAEFELRPGELVVLLGPSGSGKSTLLNILGGLDTPTDGKLWFRVAANGKAEPRSVEIGRRSSRDAEVISGLNDGDKVILHPSDRVSAGVRLAERT